MPNALSIVFHRRTLESLVVVAVLGAGAWMTVPRFSLASSNDESKSMQSALWQVRNRVEINRFSNLVRTNDEGWPMAISPEWFMGDRLPPHPLTDRELTILRAMSGHLTFPEIGRELHISRHTVKSHAQHIYQKLGARSRSGAVAAARRLGLL